MNLAQWFKDNPQLFSEWDSEANIDISPEDISVGSEKKVWWKCRLGHTWQAAVYTRTGKQKYDCPYCKGRRAWEGFNDLATVNPQLASEWHNELNGELKPIHVTIGTEKKVWWKCSKGHEWQALISSRASGGRCCPVCAGLQVLQGYNDLATVNPAVLNIWNYEKNTDISPAEITEFSKKLVWWKCEKGHMWQARVQTITSSKTASSGCPYCYGKKVKKGFNDLLFLNPEVAKEWCYELNELKPDEITAGSKKKVWWKCELGHTWQAYVHTRTGKDKTKCPYCAGFRIWEGFNDLKTVNPRLSSEWCDELNGDLKPTQVGKGTHKKVWWQCSQGHVWQAFVYARAKENGTGCPVCAGVVKDKRPNF